MSSSSSAHSSTTKERLDVHTPLTKYIFNSINIILALLLLVANAWSAASFVNLSSLLTSLLLVAIACGIFILEVIPSVFVRKYALFYFSWTGRALTYLFCGLLTFSDLNVAFATGFICIIAAFIFGILAVAKRIRPSHFPPAIFKPTTKGVE